LIAAEAQRQVDITRAEGSKQQTVLVAEGERDAAMFNATGIKAEGEAKGAAEQALLLAPVNAQITLAEKIASLPAYQQYLIAIRDVEARQAIGIENAKALAAAEIKVIATSGDASSGINSVSDVLGAKGGVQIGAMLQGLANTEAGAAVLARVGVMPGSDTKQ
jgi:flotillin